MPVAPEYRTTGTPPPLHYIDGLMHHLGHPYYVGYLSAARLHGASYQVPMVLQVVTPALLRDRRIGGSRLQFIRRSATATRPTQPVNIDTGRVTVSTPATTALDIVDAPEFSGGLGNVATVIGDLLVGQRLADDELAAAAASYPTAVVQRAGFVLSFMANEVGEALKLDRLERRVDRADYVALDPHQAMSGIRDRTWRVDINSEIEHDL